MRGLLDRNLVVLLIAILIKISPSLADPEKDALKDKWGTDVCGHCNQVVS